MTFSRFVYKNALRNKRRTFLTVLSIGLSLFLLITLRTVMSFLFNPPLNDNSNLRLVVKRNTSFTDQMPISYQQKLEKIPHVRTVMPFNWFGGMYKEPKNFFANIAVDPERMAQMFTDIHTDPGEMKIFGSKRDAAIVGMELMNQFDWKVGDRITLQGTIYPVNVDCEIVGTYTSNYRSSSFFMRWDYLNEMMDKPNTTSSFWLMADHPDSVPSIIDAVDATFRNSPAETKTETEKAFVLGFMSMLGNLQVLIGSIAGVVVFTMLLVTASTMAMTIRERLREVAILKSLGYPRRLILTLILGEAGLISFLGALVACLIGYGMGFAPFYRYTQGLVEKFIVAPETYGMALGAGILIGVISGAIPAVRASGMTITEAIRKLG